MTLCIAKQRKDELDVGGLCVHCQFKGGYIGYIGPTQKEKRANHLTTRHLSHSKRLSCLAPYNCYCPFRNGYHVQYKTRGTVNDYCIKTRENYSGLHLGSKHYALMTML